MVRVDSELSEEVEVGIHQGSVLSLSIFAVVSLNLPGRVC